MTKSTSISSALSSVRVHAPAKINLILRILDRRPDGFHNLWSIMHTVGLEDEVAIHRTDAHQDIALQCDSRTLSTDRTNLVYRAAEAVLQRVNSHIGLDIVLSKRIPMGAGLGGGSSDAAATIIGLNRLLNLNWSIKDMADIGHTLGSDVPFFFLAPSACVSGRGEQIKPITIRGSRWVILVNPGFPVETGWAYRQLASTRSGVRAPSDAHRAMDVAQETSWDEILKLAENDFEGPVFTAHPALRDIKLQLQKAGAEAALLSGSGATVFGIFGDEQAARRAAAGIPADGRLKIYVVPAASGPLLCRS